LIVTATETITNSEYQVSADGGAAAGQQAIVTLVYPPVAVDFAANPLSGTAPLTVSFANSSTNAILYLWEFGDTLTSTEVSPAHSYTQAGIYSVTLTAVGLSGSETLTRPNYLTFYEPVVVEFSAAPLTGTIPLTVTFANSSTGASGYVWNFGDGITGTTISPTHCYTQAGVYTVTLTANGPGGSDSLTQTNYIVAAAPLVAGFSASPLTGPAPFTVTFTNTSTNATDYLWDFGDGITGTLFNPTHVYTQAGIYTVTLAASDGAFTNFLTQTHFITVTLPLIRAWRQITPTLPAPPISGEHSMAYDSVRTRVVLYGGNADGWPYEDTTWEFDGTGWISITTTSRPEARYGTGLAYDPLRQATILFGGSDETDTALNQTWEYTHTDWVQLFPTTSPLSRTYHSLAANPAGGAIYLFGGNQGETHFNDLWVYQNGDWLEIQGSGTRPASRTLAALAYDPDKQRLLLFGGRSAAGTLLADLWSFDLMAQTWQELAAEGGGGPPARMAHTLTYDAAAGTAVLAGGAAGEGDGLLNDTWHYHDQTGWVEAAITPTLPEVDYHQAVYDGQTLILFARGQVWKYE
jgi:PKD repeat protein